MGVKEKVNFILQIGIEIFQNNVVNVGSQMTDGGIQKMQVMLNAQRLEAGSGSGVQLAALSAIAHVDLIYIMHQLQGIFFADVFT